MMYGGTCCGISDGWKSLFRVEETGVWASFDLAAENKRGCHICVYRCDIVECNNGEQMIETYNSCFSSSVIDRRCGEGGVHLRLSMYVVRN